MCETTIMPDGSKAEQEFASAIIDIVKHKYAKHEREYQEGRIQKCVPLADIEISPKHFEKLPYIMRGIRPGKKPESTVQEMLRLLWEKGELAVTSFPNTYRLSKTGLLYKHLTEKLANTLSQQ